MPFPPIMPTRALERLREQATLEALLVGEGTPTCQSRLHPAGTPDHPAHWYATGPCGSTIAVCQSRKRRAEIDGGWTCYPARGTGCHGYHPIEHLTFWKV